MNREVGPGSHSLYHSSPVPNKPYGFCGRKAPRKEKGHIQRCVKVEVVVLGSPSLISLMDSVDVKHHEKRSGRKAP